MNAIVYTAITGSYEKPREDILCFTESPFIDDRRSARMYKCLPPDAEYSLWLDGNTDLKVPVTWLIQTYLRDADVCVFKHPIRDCIYEEGAVCKELMLDDVEKIDEQLKRYRQEGFPAHFGLSATTYVLRRHTPHVRALNDLWWSEICRGSKRDQLSFDYARWKLGIKCAYFPGEEFDNFKHSDLFNYRTHGT